MRKRKYVKYAGSRTRLVNFIADNIIFNLTIFALLFCIGVFLAATGQQRTLESFSRFWGGIGGNVAFLLAYLAYYFITESLWGKSPAKFLTKTRVVDIGGGDADWMAIIGRSFCRVIPFEPVSFLLGKDWHDTLSNTRVVYEN